MLSRLPRPLRPVFALTAITCCGGEATGRMASACCTLIGAVPCRSMVICGGGRDAAALDCGGGNHAGDCCVCGVAWGCGADRRIEANDGSDGNEGSANELNDRLDRTPDGNSAPATFFGPDILAAVCGEIFKPWESVRRASATSCAGVSFASTG